MPWATNPIFKPKEEVQADVEAASPTATPAKGSPRQQILDGINTGFKEPSNKFTAHQIFYIFILDGLGAAAVSGGINFAIAYAMYYKEDPAKPIRLFQFPNTLAGDAGVTVIIQCLITWLIELMLVNRDLKKGGVQPIGFIREPERPLLRWYLLLDRKEQTHKVRGFAHWMVFLRSQVVRALLLAVVFFPLVWGPSIGFLVLAGHKDDDGDWSYKSVWTPEIFKLIQGAVLGLLTTPLMVMFWLTRCGWALKKNEEHYGER